MRNHRFLSSIITTAWIVILAPPVFGQIIYGQPPAGSSRIIFSHWEVKETTGTAKLDQFFIPISGFIPIQDNFDARFYLTNTSNNLDQSGNEYKVSGLSDLRLQLNHSFVEDRLLFSLGINVPTGKKKLNLTDEWPVMEYLARDHLSLPSRRFGEGFGFNFLAGHAATLGEMRVGTSAMYQYNGTYEAYTGGEKYNPGDQLNISVGIERDINNVKMSGNISFSTYSTDKLEGEKIFKQSDQLGLNLQMMLEGDGYGINSSMNYIIRGRNTRYDSTEAIFDQLKIYGNEFAYNGSVTWLPAENWYMIPSIELRLIGGNEYDFGKSNLLGLGAEFGRRIGEDFDINIGFKYFTGSADGGDIDVSGYQISAGLLAAFR